MNKDTNRVAIVTGASRGIGAAIAGRLASDGFTVVVNFAGGEAETDALAKKIEGAGGRVPLPPESGLPALPETLLVMQHKIGGGVDSDLIAAIAEAFRAANPQRYER